MKYFQKISKVIMPVMLIMLLAMPLFTLAQGSLRDPESPLGGNPLTLGEIEAIIRRIAQFLIVIGVILAVIFIVFGGIMWLTGGDSDRVKKGKAYVINGIWGAAIVLGVGVILQTIALLVTRQFFR